MHRLLLLLAGVLLVPTASAQWVFDGNFPDDTSIISNNIHGLAVTPDGNVWMVPYYGNTGDSLAVSPLPPGDADCNATTGLCRTAALHIFTPDGTPASFSPILTVDLPGGTVDTLGGSLIRDGAGALDWFKATGRGIAVDGDGHPHVAYSINSGTVLYSAMLYEFDMDGNALRAITPALPEVHGLTGPAVDAAGNVFLTSVFAGDPLLQYDTNLNLIENVANSVRGFNRNLLALPDGQTVIVPNYSGQLATVYQYDENLFAWDSTGVAFEGMAIESAAVHPTSGKIWVSAGSPNDVPSGRWTDSDGNSRLYQPHTWYEFPVSEALSNRSPVPQDSIVWNNPGDGRPRGIAFSPDGSIAYVGEFSLSAPAVQKFTFAGVAVENGPEIEGARLRQNMPNPFHGSTDITFELDDPADVRVAVYDVTGREVALLAAGPRASGTHTVEFKAGDLAGGVYVFALEVDGQRTSRRMLHMR